MSPNRRMLVPPPEIEEFVDGPGLALVEFWAGWSGESFLVAAAVDRLLRSRTDLAVRVARVDRDLNPEIFARFHAAAPPVLLLFRDGEIVDRHRGLITLDGLARWLHRALGPDTHLRHHTPSKEESS